MNPEQFEPTGLEAPIRQERTWVYPWIGVLFGIVVGIFIGHPLSMLVDGFYNFINSGTPLDIRGAFSTASTCRCGPCCSSLACSAG